jgi:16S rRNA (guanine966-N2)-methyltransferase
MHKPSQAHKGSSHLLRIIGGEWRSRRLTFADAPHLRPTPARVRETLFNWLQGRIVGACCLDLFAGSGALGFEALSRGAKQVVMVEKHPAAANALRQNSQLLHATGAQLINDDALRYLQRATERFDVIFLDPPFRQDFLPKVLNLINTRGLLNTDGLIYLEQEAEAALDFSEFGLAIYRQTKAGQVQSLLLSAVEPSV